MSEATSSQMAPGSRAGFVFVGVLAFATVVSFIHRYVPAVLVDGIRADLAISDVQFSFLQSAFALTYAAATLASGWVADRTNRRNLIVAGIALWTVGSFLFGLADSLNGLLVARIMVGMGEAVLSPAGISLLCDYVGSERRGRAIALVYFGATLGGSLAFSGGGLMLDLAAAGHFSGLPFVGGLEGWRQVVLLLSALGLLLIPLMLAFPEPKRSFDIHAADKGRLLDLWRSRRILWLVFVSGSSVAVADFAYTSWQTAFLTRSFDLTAGVAGQSLGLTALLAGTVGAWVGGIVSDRARARGGVAARIGVVRWCAVGLLASASLLLVPQASFGMAAYAGWQFVANIAYVACAVTLQDLVTDRTRALAASMSICLSIGLGLGFGPTAVAALNQGIGGGENALGPSLLITLVAMGLLTLLFATMLERRLRHEGGTGPA